MQVLNSSVARPWKLEQNTSGQASRQALRLKAMEIEQNNMTKKGSFWTSKRKKKRELLATNSKKDDFGSKLEAKI